MTIEEGDYFVARIPHGGGRPVAFPLPIADTEDDYFKVARTHDGKLAAMKVVPADTEDDYFIALKTHDDLLAAVKGVPAFECPGAEPSVFLTISNMTGGSWHGLRNGIHELCPDNYVLNLGVSERWTFTGAGDPKQDSLTIRANTVSETWFMRYSTYSFGAMYAYGFYPSTANSARIADRQFTSAVVGIHGVNFSWVRGSNW